MRPVGLLAFWASGLETRKTVTTDATGSYSVTLAPHETDVEVVSTLGVGTIKMPPVGLCAGRVFVITELLGTNDITVTEFSSGDSQDWVTPGALTAAMDRLMLYSDGKRWWPLPFADLIT